MNSARPKVLHRIAGRTMLGHVLQAVRQAGADRVAVVIGPGREDTATEVRAQAPDAEIFVQADRRGTAHAVLSAREALAQPVEDIVVAFGDTPLVTAGSFARLRAPLAEGAAVVALGFDAADPTGYGRLVRDGERLVAIREERDASPRSGGSRSPMRG
jgi:bifunctional UDP-N-acetylglucosamine pyrophosphorylase/glucosamine-1-phosphate N-acetyltransferase